MKNKKYIYSLTFFALLIGLVAATPALAETTTPTSPRPFGQGMMNRGFRNNMMGSVVFGTVSAVSGYTITVTNTRGIGTNTTTTNYTIDATNAKITKNNVAGTISDVVVGDTVMARGTLTGTNLVATTVRDGQVGKGARGDKAGKNKTGNENTDSAQNLTAPLITGNGEPIIAGTIASISGSAVTVTNKSNVTYTVDASSAKIVEGANMITISNMAVGDMIIVQGTVNGTNVTASSIIDQAKPASTGNGTQLKAHKGFFGSIGTFFGKIFGF